MKLPAIAFVALAAAASTIVPARADSDGQVNFFLGQKSLSSSDWEPLDKQFELGAVMSFGRDDWPVHIAVDVLGSADEETVFDPTVLGNVTATGSTVEIDTGVRKIWRKDKVFPYIGGGIGIIGAGLEIDDGFATVDADDAGLGLWAGGGVFFRLGSQFNIGLDLRYSSADVDLDFGAGIVAQDISAGGFSYGLLLGFGW